MLTLKGKKEKVKEEDLKKEVLRVLEERGFRQTASGLQPKEVDKNFLRKIHQEAKEEQLVKRGKFLLENLRVARFYCRSGVEVVPEKISLELREVKPNSLEEVLFKWWNLIWWSVPYQKACGRQMRFLLWDCYHDAPFGLIYLQSPVLKLSARDEYLNVPREELDLWINRSMSAHRVGALPPYNELLGGKMAALTLSCNEVREAYRKKYQNALTTIKERQISDLLFITVTSAFGKSSLYNRLKYKDEWVAIPIGYTQGSGTFHFPDWTYEKILNFLSKKGVNVERGFNKNRGLPSRKLRLTSLGLRLLGLPKLERHGIRRVLYLVPHVKNLREVILRGEEPVWIECSFNELEAYWKERWAIPRSQRKPEWKNFKKEDFFKSVERLLCDVSFKSLAFFRNVGEVV